jgi:hypothetical protein
MNTPWGHSDYEKKLERGLTWVSTPSHGGFLIGRALAARLLTPAATACGNKFGNYLAYEEDCDAAIILYELPRTRESFSNTSDAELVKSLTYWHLPYLIARGITPNPEAIQHRKDFDAKYGPKPNERSA